MPLTMGMLPTKFQPIAYVGKSAGLKTSTSGTLAVPSGTTSGDLMVFVGMSDNGSSATTISGSWTLIVNSLGKEIRLRSFYTWYDGTTSYSIGGTGQGNPLVANIFTFRNVHKSFPLGGAQGANVSGGAATPVSIPNTTTDANECFSCSIVGHNITRDSNAIGASSNGSLTGFFELEDLTTTLNWDGGFGMFGGWKTTAGAVDNTTVYLNDTYIGVRHSFFLRPE